MLPVTDPTPYEQWLLTPEGIAYAEWRAKVLRQVEGMRPPDFRFVHESSGRFRIAPLDEQKPDGE